MVVLAEDRKTMLIGFSVSNYKSFFQEQHISFVASKVARHKNHIVQHGMRKIVKAAVVYGANAGGKSNLISAIGFSRRILLYGLDKVDSAQKNFRLAEGSLEEPGVFRYQIYAGDYEYNYGIAVSYIKREIVSEWLYREESKEKEFCIFERMVGEDGISRVETDVVKPSMPERNRLKVYLDDFGQEISDSFKQQTILSDIARRTSDQIGIFAEIQRLYKELMNILIITPYMSYRNINEIASYARRREAFENLLHYFDTGVESLSTEQREMDLDKLVDGMPGPDAEQLKIRISGIVAEHPVMLQVNNQIVTLRKDENGNIIYNKLLLNHGSRQELFDLDDESDGTRRLFNLIPVLNGSSQNRLIIIDEIDRSLHTNLVRQFLALFFELTEANDTQMLATTHDSNIMDLELLRQDEIWFVERENDHSSRLYSLSKFQARFDKVVNKEYLLGRYGAIPIFRGSLDKAGKANEK